VRIRPYTPDDARDTALLFTRSVREVARRDYTEEQVLAWAPDSLDLASWNERRMRPRTRLAFLDGESGVAGSRLADSGGDELAGFSDVDDDGYIDMMFVHPGFTRRGVAAALLGDIRAEGHPSLWSNASISARGFFERNGFVVEREQQVERNGQTLTNYRMRWRRS
jgi:putative acetyltransferase